MTDARSEDQPAPPRLLLRDDNKGRLMQTSCRNSSQKWRITSSLQWAVLSVIPAPRCVSPRRRCKTRRRACRWKVHLQDFTGLHCATWKCFMGTLRDTGGSHLWSGASDPSNTSPVSGSLGRRPTRLWSPSPGESGGVTLGYGRIQISTEPEKDSRASGHVDV